MRAARPPLQLGAATPQPDDRNDDQYRTKRADDRRARRQVPPKGEKQTGNSADECNDPTDKKAISDSIGQIDSANRWRNEIAKDEQHTRDANETGHDQTKGRVEKKVPPAHT